MNDSSVTVLYTALTSEIGMIPKWSKRISCLPRYRTKFSTHVPYGVFVINTSHSYICMEFKTSQLLTFWNVLLFWKLPLALDCSLCSVSYSKAFLANILINLKRPSAFIWITTINSIVDWQLYLLNEICPCWNGIIIEDFLSTFFLNCIPRCSDITIAIIPTFVLVLEVSSVFVMAAFGASRLFLGT